MPRSMNSIIRDIPLSPLAKKKTMTRLKKQNIDYEQTERFEEAETVVINTETNQTGDREGSTPRGKITRVPFYMSVIALIISLCAFVFVSVEFTAAHVSRQREPVFTEKRPVINYEVCIECLKLLTIPGEPSERYSLLERLNKRDLDGVLKCCAKNESEMLAMVEAISILRQAEPGLQIYLPDMKTTDVSVRKQITHEIVGDVSSITNDQYALGFQPDYIDPIMEHVRGVTVLEDGLRIEYSGYYFVYCYIVYRQDIKDTNQNVFIYIYRRRRNSFQNSGVLFKLSPKYCYTCQEKIEPNSSGGVFLFNAGDFIEVFLSQKEIVDFKKESTYISLTMLGEKLVRAFPFP